MSKNILFLMLLSLSITCNASEEVSHEAYYERELQALIHGSRLSIDTANNLLLTITNSCGRNNIRECPSVVKRILDTGLVSAEAKSKGLVLAVQGRDVETVGLLLKSGASQETWSGRDKDQTPLGVACEGISEHSDTKTLDIINNLVRAGANVNAQCPPRSMIAMAMKYKHKTPLDWIIEGNFSTDASCPSGTCDCIRAQATNTLLKAGADVTLLKTSYIDLCNLIRKNKKYRCKTSDDAIIKSYEMHLDQFIGQGHGDMTTCSIQ